MKKKNFTSWLLPVPEKEHVRIVYVGKLQLDYSETPHAESKSDGYLSRNVHEMMDDIWKVSSVWNKDNFISGHLAWAESLHVAQLIEGRSEVILPLMERIRRDPRVIIHKEFREDVQVKNTEWDMSMCYWFDVAAQLTGFEEHPDSSIEELCDMIGDSFEVKRDVWGLAKFYETNIDRILMKYVSLDQESTRVTCTALGSCIIL